MVDDDRVRRLLTMLESYRLLLAEVGVLDELAGRMVAVVWDRVVLDRRLPIGPALVPESGSSGPRIQITSPRWARS